MNPDLDYQYYIFGIVFFGLVGVCAIAIGCRLYVRVYLPGNLFRFQKWGWSDRLLVLVWLGYLGCSVVNGIIRFSYGWTPETVDNHAGEKHFVDARGLQYAYVTMFWVFIFVLKGAMLCFFDEFVTKDSYYKSWVTIRLIGGLVVIGGVSSFIYQLLWCQPFHRILDGIKKDNCWVDYDARIRYTIYRQVWHVILDLMILCVPLPLVPLLKNVSFRQWVGLIVMLLLGLFCVISAITFTLGVLNWDNGGLRSPEANWFLNYEPVTEMAAAILIQCIPAIRYVLRGQGKRSRSNSYYSGGSSTMGSFKDRMTSWRSKGSRIVASKGSQGERSRSQSYSAENALKPIGGAGVRIIDVINDDLYTLRSPDTEMEVEVAHEMVHDVEKGLSVS